MNKLTTCEKPRKPSRDFPLFAHRNGLWAKKVRGKLRYFGSWRHDPDGQRALGKWLDEKDYLLSGRIPRPDTRGLTLRELANRFLTAKQQQVDSGDLEELTWEDLRDACKLLIDYFGRDRLVDDLCPADFEAFGATLARRYCPSTRKALVGKTKSVFHWGQKHGLIGAVPFGDFTGPSAATLRKHKAKNGKHLPTREQVLAMIDAAAPQMRAMVLLGINMGMGGKDLADLPVKAVDLDTGWLDFPRPKTGVARRCPLWPETIEAVRAWLKIRQAGRGVPNLFVREGKPWLDCRGRATIRKPYRKLAASVGCPTALYSLRRLFATISASMVPPDETATRCIMGHVGDARDMLAEYVQKIGDDRLRSVAQHVRDWLFEGVE